MSKQIKVIEVEGIKLDPKAKYLIAMSPIWHEYVQPLNDMLNREDIKAIILSIPPHDIKVFEVLPEDGGATQEKAK